MLFVNSPDKPANLNIDSHYVIVIVIKIISFSRP